MKSKKEILSLAANLKLKIVNRKQPMIELAQKISLSELGIGDVVGVNMLKSMKEQLEERKYHQWRDRHYYAVLRYILNASDDIDPENLDLDK